MQFELIQQRSPPTPAPQSIISIRYNPAPASGRLAAFENEFGPVLADSSNQAGEVAAVSSFENGLCEVVYGGLIVSERGETLKANRGIRTWGRCEYYRGEDRLVGLGMEEAPDQAETPDGRAPWRAAGNGGTSCDKLCGSLQWQHIAVADICNCDGICSCRSSASSPYRPVKRLLSL
jgi:hypothetical protein